MSDLKSRVDRLADLIRAAGGGDDDGDDPREVRWWSVARLERYAGLSADDLDDLSDGDLVRLAEAAGARRGLPGALILEGE